MRLTHVEDGVGCRYCATRGFQYDKPGLVYVLTDESRGAHKVGIAGAATNRVDTLARDGWVAFKLRHFANGADAYTVEQAVLSWMRDDLELPPFLSAGDGWTETVSAEAMTVLRLWQKVSELADAVEANTNESCAPGPV